MLVDVGELWSGYCREGLDIKEEDTKFYNIRTAPFKIYGLVDPMNTYNRIPKDIAAKISGGVASKAPASAGARVRFATDSMYVGIKVEFKRHVLSSPHVTSLNETGFDIYVDEGTGQTYASSFIPAMDGFEGYQGITKFADKKMRQITIYFPSSNEIFDVEVALQNDAKLCEAAPYKYEKPVVFYGSSITHGFAASRPGMTYVNQIGRMLDTNIMNFGFSGNAKGEPGLAEYLAKLDMSVFVMDYDHNAPSDEHLKNTHYDFYKIIRENNPDLPIIIVTKPDARKYTDEWTLSRKDIILNTYLTARSQGDKNVYFVDGNSFFIGSDRLDFTVDGCHPTDRGFARMAEIIGGVVRELLEK